MRVEANRLARKPHPLAGDIWTYVGIREGDCVDQNTIAIIWDFDKTLIKGYMQEPIFRRFGVSGAAFWKEVNALPQVYAEQGIQVNRDTIYLNHMITCAEQGIFAGLNNELLSELGTELKFYDGIPEIFVKLKDVVAGDERNRKFGIHVEHYIISTGLTAMIRGSKIADQVDGVWGCEFIETPIRSEIDVKRSGPDERARIIRQIGYIIDNTSKTRAVFEINKGSNIFGYVDVNSKMNDEDRRVPFSNMIYIADGPSDVPVFSILKRYGGRTLAVYPKGNEQAFEQVDQLRKDGRIDHFSTADYSEKEDAHMWLVTQAREIAQTIFQKHEDEVRKSASPPPLHINEGTI
jgi:hypothetical protein